MYRICMSGTDYVSPIENMCIRYKLYMPGTEYVCPVPPEYACPKLIKVCFFFQRESCPKRSTSLDSAWLWLL